MADHTPKKSLGQHWLRDKAVLESICGSAGVTADDTVLEIGPGLGTLTRVLLERGAHVTAVEFDHALAANLPAAILEDGPLDSDILQNLTVVEEDILRFNLQQLPEGYKVVANIPYYLTSNLIRVLCESRNPFDRAALLVQKEVAERVCAAPGSMSLLSVATQYYCEASLGTVVPARLFTPPPKVDSQVLVLQRRPKPLLPGVDAKLFFRIVKAGFSQKRKTLVNSLSGGLAIPKNTVKAVLDTAGVPPTVRAQMLSLHDWDALYQAYQVVISTAAANG